MSARKTETITVGTFRLVRAADWPATLHKAADRYEQANLATGKARSGEDFSATLAELGAAERAYGAQFLALDKQRRPDFYAGTAE